MMRQFVAPACPLWGQLTPNTQAAVKSSLLQLFQNENVKLIRRSTNDVVGMLAANIIKTGNLNIKNTRY